MVATVGRSFGSSGVEVGGVPLVDLELETLRREVALVTQEQHVFVGTLADNLRLARVDGLAETDGKRAGWRLTPYGVTLLRGLKRMGL